jgi:hypothetical protein
LPTFRHISTLLQGAEAFFQRYASFARRFFNDTQTSLLLTIRREAQLHVAPRQISRFFQYIIFDAIEPRHLIEPAQRPFSKRSAEAFAAFLSPSSLLFAQ